MHSTLSNSPDLTVRATAVTELKMTVPDTDEGRRFIRSLQATNDSALQMRRRLGIDDPWYRRLWRTLLGKRPDIESAKRVLSAESRSALGRD